MGIQLSWLESAFGARPRPSPLDSWQLAGHCASQGTALVAALSPGIVATAAVATAITATIASAVIEWLPWPAWRVRQGVEG